MTAQATHGAECERCPHDRAQHTTAGTCTTWGCPCAGYRQKLADQRIERQAVPA